VQFALAEFLQQKEKYLQLGGFLQKKAGSFCQPDACKTKFKALPSHGSYFPVVQLCRYQ